MTTTMIPVETTLDTLYAAGLLCAICEAQPWSQHARWHQALVCADCAAEEPEPAAERPGASRNEPTKGDDDADPPLYVW